MMSAHLFFLLLRTHRCVRWWGVWLSLSAATPAGYQLSRRGRQLLAAVCQGCNLTCGRPAASFLEPVEEGRCMDDDVGLMELNHQLIQCTEFLY